MNIHILKTPKLYPQNPNIKKWRPAVGYTEYSSLARVARSVLASL